MAKHAAARQPAAKPRAAPANQATPSAATPGQEIETFQVVRWLAGPATGQLQVPELSELQVDIREETYRPTIRSVVPILTVLDDGSLEEGELIRIRQERFVIGRKTGDLVLGNDATVSGRHAEIRLTRDGDKQQWTLHNLESINGTFVRVSTATLNDDTIVILGAKRFRLQRPVVKPPSSGPDGTLPVDQERPPEEIWPMLVESSGRPNSLAFVLRSPHLTIGRKGSGCGIEIDDPLLASLHAELICDFNGVWKVIGKKSRNGVWVNSIVTPLRHCCFFQCGEQRFKFVIP